MACETKFVTLGTAGGPTPKIDRAPPAHVVKRGDRVILVDCGEGTFQQLHKAGFDLRNVDDIVLSHHHFDHIGSLFAGLGLNMMLHRNHALNIYGPPGTQSIVEALLSACDVSHKTGFGVPGQTLPHPRDYVRVRELTPADVFHVGDIKISCCENTHYRTEDKFGEDGPMSLAFRFDAPDRSIVFTGDTGPCKTLEAFATGAQMLVGELIDVEKTMVRIRAKTQNMPESRLEMIAHHMQQHHLRPEQLGAMAAHAGVEKLVAVHLPFDRLTDDEINEYIAMIAAEFAGTICIGEDLATY